MFCQRVQYDDDGNGNNYFNVDHIAAIDGTGCTNGEAGNLTTTDTLCFFGSDGEPAVTVSDAHRITGTLEHRITGTLECSDTTSYKLQIDGLETRLLG